MPLMLTDGTAASFSDFERSWVRLGSVARLAHIATVSENGSPHINACYFALSGLDSLIILTPPSAIHSQNFKANPLCGIAISITPDCVGDKICGAQLECEATILVDAAASSAAFESYTKKFPEFLELAPSLQFVSDNFRSRFFSLKIAKGKIIDEECFGREVYIHFLGNQETDIE